VRIAKIKIAECCIPLPRVLKLGPIEIRTRDYVVMALETEDGVCGEAIGYPRGTPLFETLSNMAQKVINKDADARRQVTFGLEQANAPGRANLTRALSLMDIALWDIACKRAKQPLFQYLGALRTSAEVRVVVGYYVDQRSIDDVVDEVKRLQSAGCKHVKIMLKGDDADFDHRYASAVARAMPGAVAADAHWTWNTLTEARRACLQLDQIGLSFIEDPFAASDIRLTRELRQDLVTPIAAGEDTFGPRTIAELASGIDILRVDATTVGGVTGAVEATHIAAGSGRTVFPHVFWPLHVHLACSFPHVESVELITQESGADPLERILRNVPAMEAGRMSPSMEPGAGIVINWDTVEKLARRHSVVTPES
jgi:L-alanine-DL-glutamate epimerase-like enolase superfamily enzyme